MREGLGRCIILSKKQLETPERYVDGIKKKRRIRNRISATVINKTLFGGKRNERKLSGSNEAASKDV